MKILSLAITLCLLTVVLQSQEQGIIIYETTTDIHRTLPPERQRWKDMIPQFRTDRFELHYRGNESAYVVSKDQPEGDESNSRGRRWMRYGAGAMDRKVYKNLEKNLLVDSREFMTKKFLIKGSTDEVQWKVGSGQKVVLDYMCLEGYYRDSINQYTVWFTPQIPISNGPGEFAGLPGMILMVDVNDGERVTTAIEVRDVEVDPEMMEEPTKGKEVTSQEYREIVREKMREMRQQRGSGHGHRP